MSSSSPVPASEDAGDGDIVVRRLPSERRRVAVAAAVGVVTGGAVAAVGPWQLAVVAGWDAGAPVLLALIWSSIGPLGPDDTRRLATREDDSRAAARAVVVGGCVASLGGVLLGIVKARDSGGVAAVVLTVASVAAVVLSWFAVHTVFTLHYAHRYFESAGGIEFPKTDDPTYRDFAYVAFTVGMTFQVSDTEISDRSIRWLLLRHAALAYLFGTVIVGLTINLLAGLLG